MVRWAQSSDRDAVLEVMKTSDAGATCYDYSDFDADCLIDEVGGQVRGVALLALGRPWTTVLEIAIAPEHRKHLVLGNLSAAVFEAARQHGSQGVEGYKAGSDQAWINFSRERGAIVHSGSRVRWLLDNPAVERLLSRWAQQIQTEVPA